MARTFTRLFLKNPTYKAALVFIVLIGTVSLFADMTYEGARSITGPYLSTFGVTGTLVGFIAGFGELLGYTIRLFSGYLADNIKYQWRLIFIGYSINLFALPFLAFTSNYIMAGSLIVLERFGRALRIPPRDKLIAQASEKIGTGLGFGLHSFLDLLGAVAGPLIVSYVIYNYGNFRCAFLTLFLPAALAFSALLYVYKKSASLKGTTHIASNKQISQISQSNFVLLTISSSLIAFGYADFALMAFHLVKHQLVAVYFIPIIYAMIMMIGCISSLILGMQYDKIGIKVLIVVSLVSLFFAPLVFFGEGVWLILGFICWGIGMGAQNSVMKSAVAAFTPSKTRGRAFGIFDASFGVSWFIGSIVMGMLYDLSIPSLVIVSVFAQICALIPLTIIATKATKQPSL